MKPKRKIRFIINPISGTGKHKQVLSGIDHELDKHAFDIEICYTEYPNHATELAEQAVKYKIPIVAIVGGDGSVNEVARVLKNTDTALAIIPAGSGNGMARHLGIPMDIAKSIRLLNNASVKQMDTGMVNNRFFIGVSGLGFDAYISYRFAHFGKRGFWSYAKLIWTEYSNYDERTYTIEMNSHKREVNAFHITVANSSQFGNNALIAPVASTRDGEFDVCIVRKKSFLKMFGHIYRLMNGTLKDSDMYTSERTSKITISSSEKYIHVDGEPCKELSPLVFINQPKSLKVLVGQSQ